MISRRSQYMIGFGSAVALPGLLFLLSGCITASKDDTRYAKDGVQYGITDGPFRGRWWSYYERGRSFQEGGFHEEAARDFRIAIQSRRADGYWPRTYGMHFTPEYFPHRELGVNLYHQGDLEGSINELDTSIRQQFSARAAYYFKLAQEKRIAESGADRAAPTVEILTSTAQSSATEILLTGIARDDTFVSSIDVAGVPYDVRLIRPDVEFSMPVRLAPGANTIPLKVTDLAGNEFVTEVALDNDVDGPAVSFDGPVSLPGVVTGVVLDPSGVTSLTIGGIEARLEEQGGGLAKFEAALGIAPASMRFECTDALGNTTDGDIPGDESDAPAPEVALASNDTDTAVQAITNAAREHFAARVPGPVNIDFENIPEGASYYQDDIVVALEARSVELIDEVTLLGEAIPIIPARNRVYVTRRVLLDPAENILKAGIVDEKGNRAEDERTVSREKNELEITENLLQVALMANPGAKDMELTDGVIDELGSIWDRNLFESSGQDSGAGYATTLLQRFVRVERERIATIIAEQNLAAALSATEKPAEQALIFGRLKSFEMLFSLQAEVENGVLTIGIDCISSETGTAVTGRVDVAGPLDELEGLVDLLALRLLQEFPQPQGEITAWKGLGFTSALSKKQGVRVGQKCLVYSLEECEKEGISCGFIPNVVAEGFITGAATEYASGEIAVPLKALSLEEVASGEGYYAVLK